MRAAFITEFGGVDKVQIGDIPKPTPGPGQALLKVKTAALNHLDIWVIKGRPGVTLKGPHVIGSDGAGVVEALGSGCEQLAVKVGQEVILNPGVSCMTCEWCLRGLHSECPGFRITGFQLEGVYAEYALVPAVNLFPKPAHLSWQEAAALPLAHLTAWRMLFERCRMQSGETILVHGIGGGVAVAALQICVANACRVIVTSSSDAKIAAAKKMGAVAGVNYKTTPDVAAAVKALTNGRGADIVLDTAGAATLPISMGSVRRGGRIVTCGITTGPEAPINIQQLYWNHISFLGSTMGSMEDMRRMTKAIEHSGIKPLIDQTFPLSQAGAALARMKEGAQMGKIVLNVE
ncbi:MAG TPA: zinc-binding dehydrogenase [Planctomycetota bacterium]|nr:zinc-binding dehydrogenase [Planctomycetota bacterium]